MSKIVDTVEDRIQNAILTASENIFAPKIELAIRSINASSGRDATSVTANSERRERVRINASFENASENNDTLDVWNVNDETRHNIPDEVSELSVPETHFDRQAHTHHSTGYRNSFPQMVPLFSRRSTPEIAHSNDLLARSESLLPQWLMPLLILHSNLFVIALTLNPSSLAWHVGLCNTSRNGDVYCSRYVVFTDDGLHFRRPSAACLWWS